LIIILGEHGWVLRKIFGFVGKSEQISDLTQRMRGKVQTATVFQSVPCPVAVRSAVSVYSTMASSSSSSSSSSVSVGSIELWAAAKIIGRECATVNKEFLLCKKYDGFNRPLACLSKGEAATACATGMYVLWCSVVLRVLLWRIACGVLYITCGVWRALSCCVCCCGV
jgi:hypothetical protein